MARNATMMPMMNGTGGGAGKKLIALLVLIVLIALVIRDPAGSAHFVQQSAVAFSNLLDAFAAFGSALSQ